MGSGRDVGGRTVPFWMSWTLAAFFSMLACMLERICISAMFALALRMRVSSGGSALSDLRIVAQRSALGVAVAHRGRWDQGGVGVASASLCSA